MRIDLSEQQVIEAAHDYDGDVDFMVKVVDSLTTNYDQMIDVITLLFNKLPEGNKQAVRDYISPGALG